MPRKHTDSRPRAGTVQRDPDLLAATQRLTARGIPAYRIAQLARMGKSADQIEALYDPNRNDDSSSEETNR